MDSPEFVSGGLAGGLVGIASHFYNKFMLDRRFEKMDTSISSLAKSIAKSVDGLREFEIYAAREYVTNKDLQNAIDGVKETLFRIERQCEKIDEKLDKKADKSLP